MALWIDAGFGDRCWFDCLSGCLFLLESLGDKDPDFFGCGVVSDQGLFFNSISGF